jgi:hypothetical protein
MNNGAFATFSGIALWILVLAVPILFLFVVAAFQSKKGEDEPYETVAGRPRRFLTRFQAGKLRQINVTPGASTRVSEDDSHRRAS